VLSLFIALPFLVESTPRAYGLKAGNAAPPISTAYGTFPADRSLLFVIAVRPQEIDRFTKRVLDEVRIELSCRRLMTVQGVGPFTAQGRYQSGETHVQCCISRCGDASLPRGSFDGETFDQSGNLSVIKPQRQSSWHAAGLSRSAEAPGET
jgi:transposase